MYNRRNKFDPLWNTLVVGGMEKDAVGKLTKPFLGMVREIIRSHPLLLFLDEPLSFLTLFCPSPLPAATPLFLLLLPLFFTFLPLHGLVIDGLITTS